MVCEEFGCLPSQAQRELMNDPSNAALVIMEMRSFARAKEACERYSKQPTGKDMPTGLAVEQVHEIRSEIVKEDRERLHGITRRSDSSTQGQH
jgi:hypothetical protein